MMIAWYFATALFKQHEAALVYIKEGRLPLWTHNKAIQKAIESSRDFCGTEIPSPCAEAKGVKVR